MASYFLDSFLVGIHHHLVAVNSYVCCWQCLFVVVVILLFCNIYINIKGIYFLWIPLLSNIDLLDKMVSV